MVGRGAGTSGTHFRFKRQWARAVRCVWYALSFGLEVGVQVIGEGGRWIHPGRGWVFPGMGENFERARSRLKRGW